MHAQESNSLPLDFLGYRKVSDPKQLNPQIPRAEPQENNLNTVKNNFLLYYTVGS